MFLKMRLWAFLHSSAVTFAHTDLTAATISSFATTPFYSHSHSRIGKRKASIMLKSGDLGGGLITPL
jgi:hypothetical protein